MSLIPSRKIIVITISVIILLFISGMVIFWIFSMPFGIAEGEPSKDFWENTIDTAIKINAIDFGRWYKANIAIQILAILCGVAATIVASLTNQENADKIKYMTIVLTSITSVLIAGQSAFHIRENLMSYIRVNTDLENLEYQYFLDRANIKISGKSQEQIELETSKAFNLIQEVRWRSYAIIGHLESSEKPAVNHVANVP